MPLFSLFGYCIIVLLYNGIVLCSKILQFYNSTKSNHINVNWVCTIEVSIIFVIPNKYCCILHGIEYLEIFPNLDRTKIIFFLHGGSTIVYALCIIYRIPKRGEYGGGGVWFVAIICHN